MTTSPDSTGYRVLTGITTEVIGHGQAKGTVTVTTHHLNRGGIMHGGAVATLADSTLGRAVGSTIGPGQTIATASMTVSYMASASSGDSLTAMAKVRKRGRTTAVVEVDITRDGDDREVAHAIATFIVQQKRNAAS